MTRIKLIVLLLVYSLKTSAQFIIAGQHTASDYFHDVVPDSILMAYYHTDNTIDTLFLDLNNDGVNDFVLGLSNCCSPAFTNHYCLISALNNNQVACVYIDSCFDYFGSFVTAKEIASPFHDGDTISENSIWLYEAYLSYALSLFTTYSCGDHTFITGDTMYAGLRVFSGNDTLYGWVKVTGVGYTQCTVLEYACNRGIIGINEQGKDFLADVYPNPFTSQLNFTSANNEFSLLTLYDITSQKLLQKEFIGSVSLNTSQLSKGIYFFEMKNKSGACRYGKVIKE